jgi:2-polyprenyl-3-methyl-5-hydroxy-6-metoxy-1,4-benzoquinol methylase
MKKLLDLDIRIPNWNKNDLIYRNCPICNHKGNPTYTRPDNLIVDKCPNCESYFLNSIPTENQLLNFYQNYTFNQSTQKKLTKSYAKKIMKINPFNDVRISELVSMVDIKNKRILDIGCGDGQFLYLLKKIGAAVVGIDLDIQSVSFIKKFLNIPTVYNMNIEQYSIDISDTFDIIFLNDLFEHLSNPIETLKIIKKLLRPNGIIVIWTPNASFVKDENEPVVFRVDYEHIQYLTLSSCNFLANLLNLRIIHLETLGYPTLADYITGKKTRSFFHYLITVKNILYKFTLSSRFNSNNRGVRDGNYHLFCIFQKNESTT